MHCMGVHTLLHLPGLRRHCCPTPLPPDPPCPPCPPAARSCTTNSAPSVLFQEADKDVVCLCPQNCPYGTRWCYPMCWGYDVTWGFGGWGPMVARQAAAPPPAPGAQPALKMLPQPAPAAPLLRPARPPCRRAAAGATTTAATTTPSAPGCTPPSLGGERSAMPRAPHMHACTPRGAYTSLALLPAPSAAAHPPLWARPPPLAAASPRARRPPPWASDGPHRATPRPSDKLHSDARCTWRLATPGRWHARSSWHPRPAGAWRGCAPGHRHPALTATLHISTHRFPPSPPRLCCFRCTTP